MDQAKPPKIYPDTIQVPLTYSVDTGNKPINETMEAGNLERKYTGVFDDHVMTVQNGRPKKAKFSLDTHGFEFIEDQTKVENFFDPNELAAVYYPEVEKIVQRVSGASRVVIFDHTIRSGNLADREKRQLREPVHRVHNDYTEWSGPQRVRDILPDEADDLLKHRCAVIQVWRPISTPIESDPLAICEAATLSPDDLIASERRYPDRVGETYQISYNPGHKWYYFPRMTRDEALVFKVYDSEKDGRARFTAHTSFPDPTSPPDARPRESIEIRTLAFFAPT